MSGDVKTKIEELLSDFNYSIDSIRAFVRENGSSSADDLEEFAFRAAIRLGNRDYVRATAPDFKLYIKQKYLQYIDETDDADMKSLVSEYGLWVKDNFHQCELVIRYLDGDGEIVHWEKSFLKESYDECKSKDLDPCFFADCIGIEIYANGRLNFKDWSSSALVDEVIEGLEYANQKVYMEGHYSLGPFFLWQWEQDIHAKPGEKRGYMYILKRPNRFGHGKRYLYELEEG